MKKAMLISFFCSKNMGDILIGEQEKKLFERYYDITCVDFSRLAVYDRFTVKGKSKGKKNIFSKIKSVITRFSFVSYAKILLKTNKRCRALFAHNECDIVLLAGGNMIMDLTAFPIYTAKAYYILKEAKKQNKKTALMFVGVGPFENWWQLRYVKKIVSLCDYISVRDKQSAKLLKSIVPDAKVVTTFDPVFTVDEQIIKKPAKTIGVSVFFGTDKAQFENVKNGYIEIIKKLKEYLPDYKIVLYSSEIADYSCVRQLYEAVKAENCILKQIKTEKELLDFYKEVDLVLAARMHSLITALVMRTPVIGFSWQDKVMGLAEMVDMQDRFFEITTLTSCADIICDKAVKILDNYEEEVKLTDKRLNKICEEIKGNLDEFVALI